MTCLLYGDRRSGSAAVEMALAEIGAPVEPHAVPLEHDARLAADYRRINPMGRDVWRVVETHAGLRGTAAEPFLLGARFSVADIHLAVLSRWMDGARRLPAHCPKLERLARAVAARPAAGAVWRRRFGDD